VPFPELSLADQNLDSPRMEKPPTFNPSDFTLAIKNKGRPPRPWRWEIFAAGKSKPVQESEFFETMSEATRAGKAALAKFRTNQAV
jgi:hypothetical protein